MKRFCFGVVIFTLIAICMFSLGDVAAINTAFETTALEEDYASRVEGMVISKLTEEPEMGISCLDVSPDGKIALGLEDEETKIICIYSADGVFQHAFQLSRDGMFVIEWDGDNINVCFIRGDLLISISPEGELIDAVSAPETLGDNSAYFDQLYKKTRMVGDTVYRIKTDMGFFNLFATKNTQCVIIDAEGKERLIYDVNEEFLKETKTSFAYYGILFAFAIIMIIASFFLGKLVDNLFRKFNKGRN